MGTDVIGRPLKIGDAVAVRRSSSRRDPLATGRIKRLTKAQALVGWVVPDFGEVEEFIPWRHIVLLPEEDYVMHCMRQG